MLNTDSWKNLGAKFTPFDDGGGEAPGLAVGTVQTVRGQQQFGILDYGEASTYLLIPATGAKAQTLSVVVISALVENKALAIADVHPN